MRAFRQIYILALFALPIGALGASRTNPACLKLSEGFQANLSPSALASMEALNLSRSTLNLSLLQSRGARSLEILSDTGEVQNWLLLFIRNKRMGEVFTELLSIGVRTKNPFAPTDLSSEKSILETLKKSEILEVKEVDASFEKSFFYQLAETLNIQGDTWTFDDPIIFKNRSTVLSIKTIAVLPSIRVKILFKHGLTFEDVAGGLLDVTSYDLSPSQGAFRIRFKAYQKGSISADEGLDLFNLVVVPLREDGKFGLVTAY